MGKRKFKTEVKQILDLVIHSLYSNREIFLRELISNSSDAIDKLKYLTLTDEAHKGLNFSPEIEVTLSEDGKQLQIVDNGIGMNENELNENLGTIASSGTKKFLSSLGDSQKKDSNLIGQFGVGFYSAFMVADKVEVLTKKALSDTAYFWLSDGSEEYTLKEAEREGHGTTVTLYFNEDAQGSEGFNTRWSLERIIQKYSNHVAFPIYLTSYQDEYDEEGKKKDGKECKREQSNSASALWKRSKSEISEEEYKEFFHSLAHDTCDSLQTIHTKAEGTLEYTSLFFTPEKAPFDMYQADYRSGLKLYVRRIFISDDNREFLPVYLRFVRGIIDSEDLPLNVSREILQQNKILQQIRKASVKKLLSEFANLARNDKEKYIKFIEQYNRALKEGLYSDHEHREELQQLVRFRSTATIGKEGAGGWTSLEEYCLRMKEGQQSIYYITGHKAEQMANSPLLEAYKKKGFEVLILDDEIDGIIAAQLGPYKHDEKHIPIKGVNLADSTDELKDEENEEEQESKSKEYSKLLEKLKEILKDDVKDVKLSRRLTESPACVVDDRNDPGAQLQQMMQAMGQEAPPTKPILEINSDHAIVRKLHDKVDQDISDAAHLLLEQALLAAGLVISDPLAMSKRISRLMEQGF
ncbi:molecular chaperone HtpG [Candidatus Haliotispira prima]|uniref:Chaperone protein HtpG n=1 Tax=Candidatus Haliotispira prima TaxID=3034016 RepID=A0ABY8ME59_9SPIO|nr:molecular chaperone HtpG [Candidatus Haliotispira prima]